MHECFFAPFDATPCRRPWDHAHLIPKQRMKKLGLDPDSIWDERVVVRSCRAHHTRFDARFFRLQRSDLPEGVEDYASEHGLEWSLERDYGA